ncbi:MAG: BTAD domain-containing putative transcriptional regulator [Caldilineaceae bacterium]
MNEDLLPKLEFRLLGAPQIHQAGVLYAGLTSAKAQALLYYLAMTAHNGRSMHTRTALATLLWGECGEAEARTNLRKVIQHLREQLEPYLTLENQTVGFRSPHLYTVDAVAFATAIANPRTARLDQLQEVIARYHGDFLEGFYVREAPDFEAWMLGERARLRELLLQGVETLAFRFAEEGDLSQAIATTRHLLTLEPWREEIHRQLMTWLMQNGQRSAALAQYTLCQLALTAELAVEPSETTQELYERLLRQDERTAAQPATPTAPITTTEYALVGRRQVWQTLRTAWRSVMQTGAHFVCIAGEAGIGKTRLAEELLLDVQRQGQATARTRTYALEGRLAYGPLAEWLRTETLQSHLPQLDNVWLSEVARLLPELRAAQPDLPQPLPLTERWQQKHLYEALVQAFTVGGRPLLLLLDDLQWCDAETLEWLHYLLNAAPQAPILLVGTMRNDEMAEDHPLYKLGHHLHREGKLTMLELTPLSAEETAALGAQVATQGLDADATRWLYQETGGNPLFVVECVRAGLRREDKKTTRLGLLKPGRQEDKSDAFASTELPPKVVAIMQARLAQLSSEAHALAHLAASVGRAFTIELLVQASQQDEETVVNGLDELWRRRIMREQALGSYDFSHDRLRDVAYAEISPVRRRLLHRRIAQTLEQVYANTLDSFSGQVATQYDLAGHPEQAVHYYARAAATARQLYANHEVIHYLHKGLALLTDLPSTPTHLQKELEMQVALGSVLMDTQGWASLAVEEAYARAFELSRQVEKTAQLFPIVWGLHEVYIFQAKHEQALTMSQQCMDLAQQVQDPALLLQAHHALAGVYALLAPDKMKLALTHAEEMIKIYQLAQHHHQTFHYGGHDPGVCGFQLASRLLWLLGYFEQARQRAEAAIYLSLQLSHLYTWAFAFNNVATIYLFLREPARVAELTTTAIAIANEHDFPQQVAQGLILHGWAAVRHGNVAQGIDELQQGLELWKTLGVVLHRSYFPLLLAEAYAQAGELEAGLAAVDEALMAVATYHDRYWEAEIYRLRGELFLTAGRLVDEVEAAFQEALQIARRRQAKSLELRTAVSLSRLWQQQGKLDEARQLLSETYSWFTEGFDTVDLREAKALLDELHKIHQS